MKTVDKYQFNEDQPKYESGIQSFLAFHTVLKKSFTLKRISLSDDVNQSLYNYLIKEVSILKKLSHENIYRCHKMLKTKNNLYLIYDNIEGDSLEKILKDNPSFDAKLSIANQICSILLEVKRNSYVHLAVNTNNIIVQTDNKIKMINFGQAQELLGGETSFALLQPIKTTFTQYIAPEIFQNKVHVNSDVYSFGVIIAKMFEKELEQRTSKTKSEQNNTTQLKWISRIADIVSKTTIKVPDVRLTINEVEVLLKSPESDLFLMTNKSYKSSKSQRNLGDSNASPFLLNRNISDKNQEKSFSSTGSSKNILPTQKDIREQFKKDDKVNEIEVLIRKVIKRRNFVVALLYMVSACSINKETKSSSSIILSYLLLKKAAICISQLAKFLKLGKSNDLSIDRKTHQYFAKTGFYNKIYPIINKQMQSTQQKLQQITAEITKLDCFSSNSLLMEEVKHQKTNNSYLRKCAFQFLNSLSLESSVEYCQSYDLNQITGIYLISLLSTFKSYEEAHQSLFSENGMRFQDDPLIKSLLQLKKQTIFQLLELDLESSNQKIEDNISLVKSAKTLK